MNKKALIILILIINLLSAGCTSSNPFPRPPPPTGPFLSARDAAIHFLAYANNSFPSAQFILPFDVRFNITPAGEVLRGSNSAWTGNDSGNCMNWDIQIDALISQNNSYQHIIIFGSIFYVNSGITIRINSGSPHFENISDIELNSTIDRMVNSSVSKYLFAFESHQIYLIAEKARKQPPLHGYLQKIFIELERDNPNLSKNDGFPMWRVAWSYAQSESGYYQGNEDVKIDSRDGHVIQVHLNRKYPVG